MFKVIADHVSLIELFWMLINGPMFVLGIVLRRHAQRKYDTFRANPDSGYYPARAMLAKQNVRNSGGRLVFNGAFLIVGVVAMLRVNSPLTWTGIVFTVVLYVVALYFAYLDIREYRERIALDEMIKANQYRRNPFEPRRPSNGRRYE